MPAHEIPLGEKTRRTTRRNGFGAIVRACSHSSLTARFIRCRPEPPPRCGAGRASKDLATSGRRCRLAPPPSQNPRPVSAISALSPSFRFIPSAPTVVVTSGTAVCKRKQVLRFDSRSESYGRDRDAPFSKFRRKIGCVSYAKYSGSAELRVVRQIVCPPALAERPANSLLTAGQMSRMNQVAASLSPGCQSSRGRSGLRVLHTSDLPEQSQRSSACARCGSSHLLR